jgi:hypothetical protein
LSGIFRFLRYLLIKIWDGTQYPQLAWWAEPDYGGR